MGSCEKNVVQNPKERETDSFILESSQREKERQNGELILLNKWRENNAKYDFKASPYGYWIQSQSDSIPSEENNIKDLDFVQYIKQYRDLNDQVIYSFEENGIQNMILGKTEEIRGIETAIRTMGKGEKSILLLPSFMAYGLYGDENKIGAHQPILVEIEILQVKKKL